MSFLFAKGIYDGMKHTYFLAKILIMVIICSILIYLFGGKVILDSLEYHYDHVHGGMSISEVDNFYKKHFVKSQIALTEIENNGYKLGHLLPLPYSSYIGYRYSYKYFSWLYIYIIYNKEGKLILKIDAYE